MGTRTARLLATSALALVAACSDTAPTTPPALDRFYYPTGLAIRHVDDAGVSKVCLGGAPGCHTQLFVASSNFDLRYDPATGGTVMALDVDEALKTGLEPLQAPALLGVARIGSFAGELAILDKNRCSGYAQGDQVLVASRSQNRLYRLSVGPQGQLTCAGCSIPLVSTFGDPYGVTVACGTFGGVAQQLAFVTYLRTPSSEGLLSQIDLATNETTVKDLGPSSPAPAHSSAFDPVSTRLYVTQVFGQNAFSPLRWFSLTTNEPTATIDLYSLIRGAEVRGIALSSDGDSSVGRPPSRAYLALRIFDADTAAATGVRPTGDIAGALAVMDLTPGPTGQPSGRLLNVVPIDRGASVIRIVPRLDPVTNHQRTDSAGNPLRDLVAVTCTDDNTVVLYDDDTGSVAKVFDVCGGVPGETAPAPCDLGNPLTGKQPFGLAVESLATTGNARLYVGSFDRSWVNVIEINPIDAAAGPVPGPPGPGITGQSGWVRIGPERQ